MAAAMILGIASNSVAQAATAAKPAELWYSEQFTVHSQSLGRDFLIQVAKPAKPQTGKVAVVYLLDGNNLFGLVADSVIASGYFDPTAAAYVVGIGYPDQDYGQWLALRARDLLSAPLPPALQNSPVTAPIKSAADSAGGVAFQKFLLQELRPIIEHRYAVDPRRSILAGHSLGALFAAHVMLNAGAFNEYLLCSPSIWLEPQLLDKASTFSSALPVRVFVGYGSQEDAQLAEGQMSKNAQELTARLRNHASGAEVTLMTFEGRNHGTALPDCLSQGLLTLLPAPPPTTSH